MCESVGQTFHSILPLPAQQWLVPAGHARMPQVDEDCATVGGGWSKIACGVCAIGPGTVTGQLNMV